MNIQEFIDRKRIAGAREHEGKGTDWAGWDIKKYWIAIVSELLDAVAYCQKLKEYCEENNERQIRNEAEEVLYSLLAELDGFDEAYLEAACQEAEQEAENNAR